MFLIYFFNDRSMAVLFVYTVFLYVDLGSVKITDLESIFCFLTSHVWMYSHNLHGFMSRF